ncbi:MAG: class I SAM-dependent methyltransferase [Candidatus Doudnabacteria bacterium]|nr:class I SAM-dependent methyltransferase [Candidatus Doudnabacteria bacterium]
MDKKIEIWTDDWDQYELLDSGNYRRLEKYGDLVIIRSEPRAWWETDLPETEWAKADASYENEEKGEWEFKKKIPDFWVMNFDDIKMKLKMTRMSKHIGIFPEQSKNWRLISKRISEAKNPKVLNLFAYTGISTLIAAQAGASVTHVDGSKVALTWANENAEISGLKDKPIRWILDDALKFVKREVRRGSKYDAIILDPPAFGRGPKGEVWKIEDSINDLLDSCKDLISEKPLFIFLTVYSIEASSLSIGNLLSGAVKGLGGSITNGELVLVPKNQGKPLPVSLFAYWDSNLL